MFTHTEKVYGSIPGSRKLDSLPLLLGSAASEVIDFREFKIFPEKIKAHFQR